MTSLNEFLKESVSLQMGDGYGKNVPGNCVITINGQMHMGWMKNGVPNVATSTWNREHTANYTPIHYDEILLLNAAHYNGMGVSMVSLEKIFGNEN